MEGQRVCKLCHREYQKEWVKRKRKEVISPGEVGMEYEFNQEAEYIGH